jgi:hypothetical protein
VDFGWKRTGKTIEFDSTTIRNGDWIVELHLDNLQVFEEGLTMPQLFRKLKKEIKALEAALPDLYPEAKGCYGVSVFGSLLGRLGFETHPLPNRLSYFMIGLWENGIRWIHGSSLNWLTNAGILVNLFRTNPVPLTWKNAIQLTMVGQILQRDHTICFRRPACANFVHVFETDPCRTCNIPINGEISPLPNHDRPLCLWILCMAVSLSSNNPIKQSSLGVPRIDFKWPFDFTDLAIPA